MQQADTLRAYLPCGIGLRSAHVSEVMETRPSVGFLEVHSENYFGGGPKLRTLKTLRETYELSLHGVGLSLGRADDLCTEHLGRLKSLVDQFEPLLVSEHLSFSGINGHYVPDLLPVPLHEFMLQKAIDHIDQSQNHLGRKILIENPSNYLKYDNSSIPEPEFLCALSQRSGCGILLDINNIFVSSQNLNFDPYVYLDMIDPYADIGEIHLAGHTDDRAHSGLLIDTHSKTVSEPVLELYTYALRRFGHKPTLIEWDMELPPLAQLVVEAKRADACAESVVAHV